MSRSEDCSAKSSEDSSDEVSVVSETQEKSSRKVKVRTGIGDAASGASRTVYYGYG